MMRLILAVFIGALIATAIIFGTAYAVASLFPGMPNPLAFVIGLISGIIGLIAGGVVADTIGGHDQAQDQ